MYGHRNNEMLARSVSGSRLLFREPIKRCAPPLCRKDSRILTISGILFCINNDFMDFSANKNIIRSTSPKKLDFHDIIKKNLIV